MAKSKRSSIQDEAIASDLNLTLAAFTVTIKHTSRLPALVKALIFSYERDGLVYYDQVGTWEHVNGMRKKKRVFTMSKDTYDGLKHRRYNRWYFTDHQQLYPMQMSKLTDLLDHFFILVDETHRPNSHLAYPLQETPFIRKKPLVQVRRMKVTFGEPIPARPLLSDTA